MSNQYVRCGLEYLKREWNLYAVIGIIFGIIILGRLGAPYQDWQRNPPNLVDKAHQTQCAPCANTPISSSAFSTYNVKQTNDPDKNSDSISEKEEFWGISYEGWIAISTVILTLATISLGVFTFFLWRDSREGTGVAMKALELTRRISADESRAYLNVIGGQLTWGGENADNPRIAINIHNSGQTPAKWVEIFSECRLHGRAFFEATEIGNFPYTNYLNIPHIRANTATADSTLTVSLDRHADTLISAFGSDQVISVAGKIVYETIYGEIFETEFWLRNWPPNCYKTERILGTPDHIPTVRASRETSHILIIVSANLRTYEKIKSS